MKGSIFIWTISALHLNASELPKFGDNRFNVILSRNSLHFIENIPKFYDDVRFILRSHGIFIKISSPLFDLGKWYSSNWYILVLGHPLNFLFSVYPEDSHKSFFINSELKNFTENKFQQELNKYWADYVKSNFVKYCDPFRKKKLIFLAKLEEFEQQTSQEVHLLELKEQIQELTVIDSFISTNGEDSFECLYEEFLKNIYFFLDIEPCDMYFENITLLRKDTYYVEVQFKDDLK